MNSPLSDYEKKRRETASDRRRGLVKYLPDARFESIPHKEKPIPDVPPGKTETFLNTLPSLMNFLTPVLLGIFLIFYHFHAPGTPLPGENPHAGGQHSASPIILEAEAPLEGAAVLTEDEVARLDETLREGVAANEIFENRDVYSILLMGNDSRANDIAERTDAMILVSINTATGRIYLTSFLRDLYVHIPGLGSQRLNAANVVGGPGLAVDTIEQNFGISINNYAEIGFITFENIIDTLGGVDIYLTSAEARYLEIGETGGTYHLSGQDALTYCRIRSLDSDFVRTERQRDLLKTLWTDIQGISLTEACGLMEVILPQVTTDVTETDCLNLISIATEIPDYEIISHSIPATGTYEITMVKDMSVIVADMEENSAILRTTVYGK